MYGADDVWDHPEKEQIRGQLKFGFAAIDF
jgi:hypothetical protein